MWLRSDISAAIDELLAKDRVFGVFIGSPVRGGVRLMDQLALCVRVSEKRADLGRIRSGSRIVGSHRSVQTDVLGVPDARHHVLAAGERVDPALPSGRFAKGGTLTAMVVQSTRGVALLSGHGSLPLSAAGLLERTYARAGLSSHSLRGVSTPAASGFLQRGGLAPQVDFGLGVFDPAQCTDVHPALGRSPPFTVHNGPPLHTPVHHLSRFGGARRGVVTGVPPSVVSLSVRDGTMAEYRDVYEVTATDGLGPFSHPGDSGSLVFGEDHRAVGTIVGGSVSAELCWVLPLTPLAFVIGPLFHSFFQ